MQQRDQLCFFSRGGSAVKGKVCHFLARKSWPWTHLATLCAMWSARLETFCTIVAVPCSGDGRRERSTSASISSRRRDGLKIHTTAVSFLRRDTARTSMALSMAVPRYMAARPTTLMASMPCDTPAPTMLSTENCREEEGKEKGRTAYYRQSHTLSGETTGPTDLTLETHLTRGVAV